MQLNIKMRKQRAGNFKEIRFPGGEKVKRHFQINFGESSIRFTAVIPNTHLSSTPHNVITCPLHGNSLALAVKFPEKRFRLASNPNFVSKFQT
jgi:hypothetical protein